VHAKKIARRVGVNFKINLQTCMRQQEKKKKKIKQKKADPSIDKPAF